MHILSINWRDAFGNHMKKMKCNITAPQAIAKFKIYKTYYKDNPNNAKFVPYKAMFNVHRHQV